jgi:hypothetical protein
MGALFWLDPAGGNGVGITDFPLDDGWIHMVYARNLATTLRTDYNAGTLESGMTSPLWVILNAFMFNIGKAFSLNPTAMPKFLSLLFSIFSSILVYILVRARCHYPLIALAAALVLTLDPRWSFSRAAGMEVTLFASLLLLTFVALDMRRDLLAGLSFGLACIARPEGLVLIALLVPAWYLLFQPLPRPHMSFVKLTLPAALMFGCWMVYNILVTGHLLPNTFYVKAQTKEYFRTDNLRLMWEQMLLGTHFLRNYLGIFLYLAGVSVLVRRNWKENIFLILFPWLFFFSLSVTHTFLQSRPYYWDRYFHPVIPFLIIPVFLAFQWPRRGSAEKHLPSTPPLQKALLPALITAALIIVSFPGIRDLHAYSGLFSTNCRDIRTGNVETGKWLKPNTRPGDWIATMDGGAIRYFSERNVLDMVGLNNHRLLEKEAGAERNRLLLQQIKESEPSYYVLFPRIFSGFIGLMNLEPVKVITLKGYSIIAGNRQSVIAVYVDGGSQPRPGPQ